MLLAEELLLLLLDDERGAGVRAGYAHEAGLAGALLLDLAEAGRLADVDGRLAAGGGPSPPSGPPALAAAWEAIAGPAARPRGAKHWVAALPKALKPLRGTIAESLVARGVLDERRHKLLGVFATTRYPELDPGPERELRARLRGVLVEGAEPDAHTAALLCLLVPMDLIKPLVAREERKAAVARAKAVARRGAVGDAVKAAVQAQLTAAVAAGAAAAAVTT